jgi:DsbC/DsbD-like thiol-disulfide interchange protein
LKLQTVVALLASLAVPSLAPGQKLNPAQWSLAIEPDRTAPGSTVTGRLSVKLDPGWHLYSLTTPRPPIATSISDGKPGDS